MAAPGPRYIGAPISRSVLWEWALLTLVIGAVIAYLWREAQAVQALAERASVQSTLGALRTSLALEQMAHQARGEPVPPGLRNPFLTLERMPSNYAGEIDQVNALQIAPGQWVFDGHCGCIAYRPLYPQWLDGMSEVRLLWFQLKRVSSMTLIDARENYVWQGLQLQ